MSNKVKLISEEFVSDVEYITEEKENGKKDCKTNVANLCKTNRRKKCLIGLKN